MNPLRVATGWECRLLVKKGRESIGIFLDSQPLVMFAFKPGDLFSKCSILA